MLVELKNLEVGDAIAAKGTVTKVKPDNHGQIIVDHTHGQFTGHPTAVVDVYNTAAEGRV